MVSEARIDLGKDEIDKEVVEKVKKLGSYYEFGLQLR